MEVRVGPQKTMSKVAVPPKIERGDRSQKKISSWSHPLGRLVELGQDFARGPGGRYRAQSSLADCVLPSSWAGPFGTVGGRCHCQDQLRYGRAGASDTMNHEMVSATFMCHGQHGNSKARPVEPVGKRKLHRLCQRGRERESPRCRRLQRSAGSDQQSLFSHCSAIRRIAGSCPKAESRGAEAHGKCRCWHERIIKQGGSGWQEEAGLDFSSAAGLTQLTQALL